MKISNIKNIYAVMGLIISLVFTSSCNNDDHFDPNPSIVSGKSLMETIVANKDLSEFAKLLQGSGYGDVLSRSETYTVWAPKNDALQGLTFATMNDTLRFVKNHIARFNHPASGTLDETILMTNTKLLKFVGQSGNYEFAGVKIETPNISTDNGLIHIVENQVPFAPNLWEKMEDPGFENIKNYLYSFTKMEFNQSQSNIIDYNEEGLAVYDSVFNEKNVFWEGYPILRNTAIYPEYFYRGGFYPINNEDSVYTMLLPTNEAWDKAYAERAPYFVNNSLENPDSIQDYYTKFSIVQDLVFRGDLTFDQEGDNTPSFVTSTRNGTCFPEEFQSSTPETLSNGTVYVTNEFTPLMEMAWNKELVIEATESNYYILPPDNVLGSMSMQTDPQYMASFNTFQYIESKGTVNKVYIEYLIPNTLAATYDIYCRFMPDNIKWPTTSRKTKVKFTIFQYNRETGEYDAINSGGEPGDPKGFIPVDENGVEMNEVNDTIMTDMLIAKDFKLPYSFINESNPGIKIKVETNISRPNELGKYANRMSIDYLRLVPKYN
ncbi:putative surface protein with fasciclin (FAS1) repeats [Dysgonomonadaceae bacterium PH5-43]|nr:putative surface protein with fasciclin (FAS1) repeats [Dysgonomonadaceae bacterium PH5-43]